MNAGDRASHRTGLILVGASALFWSLSGFFTRAISADLMTMLFWGGIFSGGMVLAVFFLMERGNAVPILKNLGLSSLGVTFFSAMGLIAGIGAFRYTTIAEAMVIYATVPFVTAGTAWLFLRERASYATLVASAVALTGVTIMLAGSDWGGSLLGKALAVVMTLCMALLTTIIRSEKTVPMLPAMGASSWLSAAICFFWAHPMEISARDFWLSALFGAVQNAMGLVLYTLGSRRIPASEATLIAALEVPLTPFWVWLVFNETPDIWTIIGGTIVFSALLGYVLREFRRSEARV
ncbi:DMT family transporter [Aestuariivirga sp.]|uniref:DMT family transporter n=1 Tax=Aestuariivirga sp. TaxID=2650926 RepID=UPI0039E61425